MHPKLFEIAFWSWSVTVMSYSFFYFCAVMIVVWGTYLYALQNDMDKKKMRIFLVSVVVSGFVCARLWHVATNWQLYDSDLMSIFLFRMENFSIVGGLLGAIVVGYIVCKILRVDHWILGDIAVVPLCAGIACARIGCFLNGCCFGEMTALSWGVHFPHLSQAHLYQLSHGFGEMFSVAAVHPTQLYEMFAVVVGGLISLWCIRKKMPSGVIICFFGLWFSVFRLTNMYVRVLPDSLIITKSVYAVFYGIVAIICILLLVQRFMIHKTV